MKLAGHDWALEVAPTLGGAILSLRHRGDDVLRPAPRGAASPLDTACFPLVPYANRIADGTFSWNGERHRLPRNFGDHPHSLHGIGWQRPWTVAQADAAAATLAHEHDGSEGWPWPYCAEQRIALAADRATITLSIRSRAPRPVPAGLGLHPYFPCGPATRLQAAADRIWLSDETLLPTAPVDPTHFCDWVAGAGVAGNTLIDNAYDGWDGRAVITQPWGQIHIAADGACGFHLYRPPTVDFFCFEPVGHLPDAINREGMQTVAPGETIALSMTLAVTRPADHPRDQRAGSMSDRGVW